MGSISESHVYILQVTKAQIVDNLLGGVSPGVSVNDIADVNLGDDSTFIEVVLDSTTSNGKTTTRHFNLTRDDFATEVLSLVDPSINDGDAIADIRVDAFDAMKINVTLKRVKIAVY